MYHVIFKKYISKNLEEIECKIFSVLGTFCVIADHFVVKVLES